MQGHASAHRRGSRPGITDLWNSELCEGAEWTALDNPQVHSNAKEYPVAAVSWKEAKRLHARHYEQGDRSYRVHAFIHCYIDDQKFDGEREGIWKNWHFFYEVASHFDGIMGVDFSTNVDFPEPLKRHQFHKMRVIEYGATQRGIPTIPNARWGMVDTWEYCFDALPEHEMLSIGAVGSGLRNIENRSMFDAGLRKLIELKDPSALIVIGSTNYPAFREVRKAGIAVVSFDGDTCTRFKRKESRDV